MTKSSTKSNINPHWFSIEKQVAGLEIYVAHINSHYEN
jgi:hypothetical protein